MNFGILIVTLYVHVFLVPIKEHFNSMSLKREYNQTDTEINATWLVRKEFLAGLEKYHTTSLLQTTRNNSKVQKHNLVS